LIGLSAYVENKETLAGAKVMIASGFVASLGRGESSASALTRCDCADSTYIAQLLGNDQLGADPLERFDVHGI